MSDKPSYLGLLNAIAVGEAGGEALFEAWAAATPNDDVRAVLNTVALREGEHARQFTKRINELGYSVIPKDDPGLPDRVAMAERTDLTDCEKFERLGFTKAPAGETDIFSKFFQDVSMDISTGELMGRYVAEERDTGRRLRECYAIVSASAPSTNGTASLEARLERIECALAELAAAADKPKARVTAKKK
jgi:rubrerythrin